MRNFDSGPKLFVFALVGAMGVMGLTTPHSVAQDGAADPAALDPADVETQDLNPTSGARDDDTPWIRGRSATLRGLDKVTAQTRDFTVMLDEPTRFGTLTIVMATPCAKRPPERTPETWVGLEISDPQLDRDGNEVGQMTVYRGWMLAESPGVSPLDHQVYDVWPLACHGSTTPTAAGDGLRPGG